MFSFKATLTFPSGESMQGVVANFRKLANALNLTGILDLDPYDGGGGQLIISLSGTEDSVRQYDDFVNSVHKACKHL